MNADVAVPGAVAGIVGGLVSLALLARWRDLMLHAFDAAHARALGLPVGLFHYGLLAVLCDYDAARFGAMDARFTAAVYPGETLRTEIWTDGSFRTRVLERDIIAIDNGLFKHRQAS